MYYAIYKEVRNSVWKCLTDFELDTLPIDVLKITRAAGIRVIKNSTVNDLLPEEHGKAYFDGSRWTIIYDDLESTPIARFTVAHELGHIFLGHDLKHIKYAEAFEFQKKPKSEQQADLFAMRLLCPACVLWGMNLQTSQEIAETCRIPLEIAQLRAKRMKVLYRRGKFLTDPMEQALYRQFGFDRSEPDMKK